MIPKSGVFAIAFDEGAATIGLWFVLEYSVLADHLSRDLEKLSVRLVRV